MMSQHPCVAVQKQKELSKEIDSEIKNMTEITRLAIQLRKENDAHAQQKLPSLAQRVAELESKLALRIQPSELQRKHAAVGSELKKEESELRAEFEMRDRSESSDITVFENLYKQYSKILSEIDSSEINSNPNLQRIGEEIALEEKRRPVRAHLTAFYNSCTQYELNNYAVCEARQAKAKAKIETYTKAYPLAAALIKQLKNIVNTQGMQTSKSEPSSPERMPAGGSTAKALSANSSPIYLPAKAGVAAKVETAASTRTSSPSDLKLDRSGAGSDSDSSPKSSAESSPTGRSAAATAVSHNPYRFSAPASTVVPAATGVVAAPRLPAFQNVAKRN